MSDCCGNCSDNVIENTSLIINYGKVWHVSDQNAFNLLLGGGLLIEGHEVILRVGEIDESHWIYDALGSLVKRPNNGTGGGTSYTATEGVRIDGTTIKLGNDYNNDVLLRNTSTGDASKIILDSGDVGNYGNIKFHTGVAGGPANDQNKSLLTSIEMFKSFDAIDESIVLGISNEESAVFEAMGAYGMTMNFNGLHINSDTFIHGSFSYIAMATSSNNKQVSIISDENIQLEVGDGASPLPRSEVGIGDIHEGINVTSEDRVRITHQDTGVEVGIKLDNETLIIQTKDTQSIDVTGKFIKGVGANGEVEYFDIPVLKWLTRATGSVDIAPTSGEFPNPNEGDKCEIALTTPLKLEKWVYESIWLKFATLNLA